MGAFDAYIRLDGSLSGSICCDEPMARHTTYRIGGPAALFVSCETLADLSLVLEVLAEEEVQWTVVGKGSNLLVADEGYDGAVITLGREFGRIDFNGFEALGADDERPEAVHVTAGAGAALSMLVQKAFSLGLSGMEFAVGTPGSVGGAIRMNAGSRDQWMSSVVESVVVYQQDRGLSKLDAADIQWDYRSSSIPDDAIVVEAGLKLVPSDKMMLHAVMEASLKRRRASQPISLPSCGSVFRGPDGDSAGRLLELSGLKGLKHGGAEISSVHANFIVNNGGATAQDVLELMEIAKAKVKEEHGVELRPEVRFLGFPQD